jgi:hypothetical protein
MVEPFATMNKFNINLKVNVIKIKMQDGSNQKEQ